MLIVSSNLYVLFYQNVSKTHILIACWAVNHRSATHTGVSNDHCLMHNGWLLKKLSILKSLNPKIKNPGMKFPNEKSWYLLKLLIDTGEYVQKWTRVFSTQHWVIIVARMRRKKGKKILASTFGRFRLWTGLDSSPVSVRIPMFKCVKPLLMGYENHSSIYNWGSLFCNSSDEKNKASLTKWGIWVGYFFENKSPLVCFQDSLYEIVINLDKKGGLFRYYRDQKSYKIMNLLQNQSSQNSPV